MSCERKLMKLWEGNPMKYLLTMILFTACAAERVPPELACEEAADRLCTQFEECFTWGERAENCRAAVEAECVRSEDPGSPRWLEECDEDLDAMTCSDIHDGLWKFTTCFSRRSSLTN